MSIRRGNNILASSGTNGLALFDFKWSDHTIVDPNWILSSPNSWHSGNTYKKMYNHLQTDYTNGESQSETIATYTITYMLAPDGHKIILPEHETIAQSIYTATGVAWYYVLDTTNKQFKLPRTKYAFNSGAPETVGNYIEPGLPNITGKLLMANHYNYDNTSINNAITGAFATTVPTSAGVKLTQAEPPSSSSADGVWSVTMDASRCSSIYGNSTTVQPPAVSMLLYFFTDQFENGQQEAQETYALDSTVVHLTGNETIAGTKTFVNKINANSTINISSTDALKLVHPDITKGTNPSNTKYQTIEFNDSTNSDTWENTRMGIVYHTLGTDGISCMTMAALKNTASSGDSASIVVKEDTSGNKICETNGAFTVKTSQRHIYLVSTGMTKGTTPATQQLNQIVFNDSVNSSDTATSRLGVVEHSLDTSGNSLLKLSAVRNTAGSTNAATFELKETNGGVASCSFPNTTCCDSDFHPLQVTIVEGVNVNGSTAATYTLTDLPNDNKKYMALIAATVATGSTSGNNVLAQITTNLMSGALNIARAQTRTSAAVGGTGACWVPVASDRKLILNKSTNWTGTATLYLRGYRRIGSND